MVPQSMGAALPLFISYPYSTRPSTAPPNSCALDQLLRFVGTNASASGNVPDNARCIRGARR